MADTDAERADDSAPAGAMGSTATDGDPEDHGSGSDARGGLTRAQIIETAIALVDAEGVGALSMRRLGAEIGVEAMALYRYVDGREDLLDAMVDEVSGMVESAASADVDSAGGWRAYLWRLAHQMRDLALRHPNLFPLVATRHPAAPWLRPPLRNLEVVEEFLSTLLGAGFDEDQVAVVYRTFASFLLGHLLLTAAQEARQNQGPEPSAPGPDAQALTDYPTIASIATLLSAPRNDAEEFAEALENMLEGIAEVAGEPRS
ncbi:TetR/AcrR family transcriptional regulator [Pseudactinotalea sp. Z1748]|uniref:TetR/AcrR family transcriptional regulator n=1 Tax=Pseudactinotalea sp. Z1748 TaxID=3413027 RepID=UPI003C7D781B